MGISARSRIFQTSASGLRACLLCVPFSEHRSRPESLKRYVSTNLFQNRFHGKNDMAPSNSSSQFLRKTSRRDQNVSLHAGSDDQPVLRTRKVFIWRARNRRVQPHPVRRNPARQDRTSEIDHLMRLRLEDLRKLARLSRADVANKARVTPTVIHQNERNPNPEIKSLRRYLAVLGAELECVAVFADRAFIIEI